MTTPTANAVVLEVTAAWLRPKDAARYLGLSIETLRTYRSRGIGPAYRSINGTGSVLYSVADLDAWVLAQPRHLGTRA